MNRSKIAFIHYPRSYEGALLESMPFVFNVVKALDGAGHHIDLYIWEDNVETYREYFSANVNIKKLRSCKPLRMVNRRRDWKNLDWLNNCNRAFIELDAALAPTYDLVFGAGQIGIYIASILARHSHCDYIYLNDEFPSSYHCSVDNYWNRQERLAVSRASLVVVPDLQRATPLLKDLQLADNAVDAAVIPNAVMDNAMADIDWESRLGIPENRLVLLQAGAIADWTQIPEILGSMAYWPDNAVLILNNRVPVPAAYKRQIGHLILDNRVFWNVDPLREDELSSLINYSHINFALYRDKGDNTRYIGWAAGKLLRSIMCGRPVIASNFPSLSFVDEHRLGKLVTHPSEIPDAIRHINQHQQEFMDNCLQYASDHLSFGKCWKTLSDKIESKTGIQLL